MTTKNESLNTDAPTLREAISRATARLEASAHLRADAHRDAAFLLRHALGISHATQLAETDRRITPDQQAAYDHAILRRLTNEPIQYITGEQEFYGLTLHVTPSVLIPRPETEHVVEAVLVELASHPVDLASQPVDLACHPAAKRTDLPLHSSLSQLRIVDVGTGSGAIAIALAYHLPNAHITALDFSPAALEVAASNATHHQLADRIRFVESDLLAAISPAETNFDAIVSNPPYVALADRDTLHPQVRDHEPHQALFAGSDGLEIYRRLIPQAHAALKPGGIVALEIGHGQRDAIASLLRGWKDLRFIDDLQHIPRVVLARKQ